MARLRAWLPPLVLVALCIGMRLVLLEADPPSRYPTGRFAQELFVEGAAKAHEARRFGLFGTLATRSADSYHIWSVQSPAYVLPLAAFFRTFGVSWATLRIFGALAAGLGLLALHRLAREHRDPLVAPIACLIVALNFFDVHLTRSGLLEPFLNAVLALAFLAGLLALRSLPWLLLCVLAYAAALLTKQTAAFAFPVLLGLGIAAQVRARARGAPAWQHVATIGLAIVVAAALLLYASTPAYWATVQWNFGHMLVGVERHEEVRVSAIPLGAIARRLVDPKRWLEGHFFIVPLLPLALAQIVRIAIDLLRRRRVDRVDLVAACWLLSAIGSLALTEHVRPRFSIVILPPTALLAGSLLAGVARFPIHRAWRVGAFGLAIAVVLATDGNWHQAWWRSPRYEFRDAGRKLQTQLDEDSVVVGAWASPLAFETQADTFYVKGPFNTSKEALAGLGITHLLVRDHDPAARIVARRLPELWRSKKERLSLRVLGARYTLFEAASPSGARSPAIDSGEEDGVAATQR